MVNITLSALGSDSQKKKKKKLDNIFLQLDFTMEENETRFVYIDLNHSKTFLSKLVKFNQYSGTSL